MKRLITIAALTLGLLTASTHTVDAVPQTDPYPSTVPDGVDHRAGYCLSVAGLSLAEDGAISIYGMQNHEWRYAYAVYGYCMTNWSQLWFNGLDYGSITEDGVYTWLWNGYGPYDWCLPLAACDVFGPNA